MTDKTKRIILIAAGVLLCAALVVGIVSRLAAVPMPIDPAIPDDTPNTKDPVVNISDPEGKVDSKTDGEQVDSMIPAGMLTAPAQNRPFRVRSPSRTRRSIPARRRRTMRRMMCRTRTVTRKRRPPTSRSRLR